MMTHRHEPSILECIMSDISCLVQQQSDKNVTPRMMTRTIRDFTGMDGAVKMELCAKSDKEIIVTYVGGDVRGVYGIGKNELIGRNILKVGKMSPEYVSKIMEELAETGFVFKILEFNNRTIYSILMLREGNNLVEISWNKDAIR